MSTVGKPERATQDRVIALFRDELRYRYLGERANGSLGQPRCRNFSLGRRDCR